MSEPDVAAELARQAMEQAPLLHSKGRLDKWRACARRQKRRAALPCTDLAKAARNDGPGLWVRMPSTAADILNGSKALGKARYASHPRESVDPVLLIYGKGERSFNAVWRPALAGLPIAQSV